MSPGPSDQPSGAVVALSDAASAAAVIWNHVNDQAPCLAVIGKAGQLRDLGNS